MRKFSSKGRTPTRSSAGSAGYDFYAPYSITLAPGESHRMDTGVKAHIGQHEVVLLVPRSGLGSRGLVLLNTIGVVDSDYGDHIVLMLKNAGHEDISINEGDRVVQALILSYLITADDNTTDKRSGGFGSSGK